MHYGNAYIETPEDSPKNMVDIFWNDKGQLWEIYYIPEEGHNYALISYTHCAFKSIMINTLSQYVSDWGVSVNGVCITKL